MYTLSYGRVLESIKLLLQIKMQNSLQKTWKLFSPIACFTFSNSNHYYWHSRVVSRFCWLKSEVKIHSFNMEIKHWKQTYVPIVQCILNQSMNVLRTVYIVHLIHYWWCDFSNVSEVKREDGFAHRLTHCRLYRLLCMIVYSRWEHFGT